MSCDVVIIGAGVLGCATALELANSGASVQLLERGESGRESSWAGGGILYPLLPWDYAESVTALVQRSIGLFPAWTEALSRDTGIDPEFQRSGMLVLPSFSTGQADTWCRANTTHLSQTHAQAIIPNLAQDDDALWLPDVSQARNPRLLKALRRKLEMLGVKIAEQTEVTALETRDGVVTGVNTSRGKLSAERYIVTSGAWSKTLLGKYALNLNIYPIRGQMLLFKGAPDMLRHIVLKNGMYLIPRRDGHILVGSTLEDVGFDKATTQEAKALLFAQATDILPQLKQTPLVQHWAGLRPGSPDNIPAIDCHPQLQNLYINSGHFRYGVTMAPASAEIMANLIAKRSQAIDITPYRWPATDPGHAL